MSGIPYLEMEQGYRQEDPKGLPPAVSWVGGKARLAVHIAGLIPPHRVYVEPFAGMASVLLRKPPSVREVLNDKSPDVVRFLRSLKRPPLCRVTIGERTFRQLKAQRGNLSPCSFVSLQSCSFGGKGKEFAREKCTSRPLYHRNRPLYAKRMKDVVVTQGDWEKAVRDEDSPDTFFYLDPPYLGAVSGLAYARGDIEPERLARILQKVKGKFLVTVNDLAAWRGAFSWAQIRPFFSHYTVAKASNTIKGRQLFISNYQLPVPQTYRQEAALVRISGVCKGAEPSCSITVKAAKEVKAVATSPSELAQAIAEVRRLFEEKIGRPEPVEGDRSQTFAIGPTGRRYEFEYRVVEAESLVTSHDPFTFELDPRFTKALQPRVRERAAAQAQVLRIAAALDPDQLLLETHTLDRGAPIIGPDMLVESGNGRVMGVKRAAQENKPTYEKYWAALRDRALLFGLSAGDADKMGVPVLVRLRLTALADKDRQAFVQEANEPTGIEMSPVEKARSDAQRLTPAMLGTLDVAEGEDISDALRAPKNRVFVQSFLGKLPPNEQARLVDAQGQISQEGVRRMVLAIFMAAFPGGAGQRLAEMAFESADMEMRTVFNGVARALGFLAQSEALTRFGNRRLGLAIGEDLAKAVSVYALVRRSPELTVDKYLAQSQLFERELSPFQETILRTLVEKTKTGAERALPAKRLASILAGYAQMVIASPPPGQAALIEGAELSKEEMWATAVKVATEPEPAPQPAMFTRGDDYAQFLRNWLLVGKTVLGLPVGVRFLRAAFFNAERLAQTWGVKIGAERVDLYEWDGRKKQPKSPIPERVLQLARGEQLRLLDYRHIGTGRSQSEYKLETSTKRLWFRARNYSPSALKGTTWTPWGVVVSVPLPLSQEDYLKVTGEWEKRTGGQPSSVWVGFGTASLSKPTPDAHSNLIRSFTKDHEVAYTICNREPARGLRGSVLGSSARGDRDSVHLQASCPDGAFVVGTLHTHPGGDIIPSRQDREAARREGLKYLCVGVPETGALRCEKRV